jgi:hypothetical protein
VLWTCTGVGDSNSEKKGYYLQFAKSASADINSTNLQWTLIQSHLLDEASLNQLSTEALLELLAPVLRSTGIKDSTTILHCKRHCIGSAVLELSNEAGTTNRKKKTPWL